jgi:hypothetical protein
LRTIPADEDLRNLSGAVETNSDQYVQLHTIEALNRVFSGFKWMFQAKFATRDALLDELRTCKLFRADSAAAALASEIVQCNDAVHSLKDLYSNASDKHAVTLDVAVAAKEGTFVFELKNGSIMCDFTLEIVDKTSRQVTRHSADACAVFRSKALLLTNSAMTTEAETSTKEEAKAALENFIKLWDGAQKVSLSVHDLHQAGCSMYRTFDAAVKGLLFIEELRDQLSEELRVWQLALSAARSESIALCYLRAQSLWALTDFFEATSHSAELTAAALSTVRYLVPTANVEILRQCRSIYCGLPAGDDAASQLRRIGEALNPVALAAIAVSGARVAAIPEEARSVAGVVAMGSVLYVGASEGADCTQLGLSYVFAAGQTATLHEVMLCDGEENIEDLDMFLARCFHGSLPGHSSADLLHCIVLYDDKRLDVPRQLHLHRSIESLRERVSSTGGTPRYRLVVIGVVANARGAPLVGSERPTVAPVECNWVAEYVRQLFPRLLVVCSAIALHGKTEYIRSRAFSEHCVARTVPLSGPLDRALFIQSVLKYGPRKEFERVHFDIGSMTHSSRARLHTWLVEYCILGGGAIRDDTIVPVSHVWLH